MSFPQPTPQFLLEVVFHLAHHMGGMSVAEVRLPPFELPIECPYGFLLRAPLRPVVQQFLHTIPQFLLALRVRFHMRITQLRPAPLPPAHAEAQEFEPFLS